MSLPDVPLIASGKPEAHACRRCGQPMSALARMRGDVCDAMDCRRFAADARADARRVADVRAAAARAQDAPALASAPLLWLRHHDADVAAPTDIEIAALRAHLLALEGDDSPAPPSDAGEAGAADAPAIGGHLCALCRGRCCRFGLRGNAFIEAHQLRGWLVQRPGATWLDAVDHYLGFVATEHLDASCLFHAPTGCALPRERRSDVCNQFACDTLAQARDLAAAQSQAVVLVGIVASQVAVRAAVVSSQGSRELPELK